MLQITDAITINDDELSWTFSRSGGPGGQNVNKVASKAQLSWFLEGTSAVTDSVKDRLRKTSCTTACYKCL